MCPGDLLVLSKQSGSRMSSISRIAERVIIHRFVSYPTLGILLGSALMLMSLIIILRIDVSYWHHTTPCIGGNKSFKSPSTAHSPINWRSPCIRSAHERSHHTLFGCSSLFSWVELADGFRHMMPFSRRLQFPK